MNREKNTLTITRISFGLCVAAKRQEIKMKNRRSVCGTCLPKDLNFSKKNLVLKRKF